MDESALPDRLYKYSPADTAKIILTSGHMRWSSVLLFNDVHEAALSYEELKQKLGSLVADRLRLILRRSDHPPVVRYSPGLEKWCKKWRPKLRNESTHADVEAELIAAADRLAKGMADRELENRQVMEETRRMSRVICFSSDPQSVTMWAHYADDHRGAILGFDPSMDEIFRTTQRVRYQDKPLGFASPEIVADWLCGFRTTEDRERHFEDIQKLLYITKSDAWEYEKEWRCTTGGPAKALQKECSDLIQFSRRSVRQIIFGDRRSQSDRDEIHRIIDEKNMTHVEFLEATPSQGNFGMDVTRVMSQ